ncbi:polysaccharide biosynthesis/export family protein [Hymenobacter jejuensis]|uniref:Polysaccharide export protein EpsE n=1 Tax=Hymenobacter jejuensis TaxID=2502781 RepID=A0A5B8A0A6_9BACT|nr:polysaccharide biosynthesis/export family protein [Hymenobacter jejuensis]QDA60658.1 polysaccharide export protein EpsE [Hymenobacter jejuensis]
MQQPDFRRLLRFWLLCLPAIVLLASCTASRVRQQNTMFRTDGGVADTARLRTAVNRLERNYVIQPNDYLDVRVFTNKGERILDPNGELQFGAPAGLGTGTAKPSGQQGSASSGAQFLVQNDGIVKLPMVDYVKISGLTLLQADSLLQIKYSEFYRDVFVITRVSNNRIIVLGAVAGASGQVIPLVNDNMNLLEVLALAGGIEGGAVVGTGGRIGRADNIRLIRGDLKNPQVQVINLTTFEGMRRANLQVEPNDIIYVEPIRRPFFEALSDVAPLFGIVSGLTGLVSTILFVAINLK